MIYADNAATTQLDKEAFENMKQYLLDDYANASQPYLFSKAAKVALKKSREVIAGCISALPEEIYFTSCGSESNNWAIKGMIKKDFSYLTITSKIEHHSILNSCRFIQQFGFPVKYLPVNTYGVIEPDELLRSLDDNTNLVSIMFANNEIGTLQDIKKLCNISHDRGAFFHTDAVQAVGHVPINVKELDVDMLSASGHKFNAPKGIGFLYIKNGTPIAPFINGGSQEFGKRAGTENVALAVAMATALQNNCLQLKSSTEKLLKIEQAFTRELNTKRIDYIRNGYCSHIPGHVSISIKNANGEMLLHRLDLKGICISTGSACDSNTNQLSHVIKAIGVPLEYANGTIRISFGKANCENDAIIIANEIASIIEKSHN